MISSTDDESDQLEQKHQKRLRLNKHLNYTKCHPASSSSILPVMQPADPLPCQVVKREASPAPMIVDHHVQLPIKTETTVHSADEGQSRE